MSVEDGSSSLLDRSPWAVLAICRVNDFTSQGTVLSLGEPYL